MANKRTNNVLLPWKEEEAEVIFEYDIPRLGNKSYI